MSTTKDKAYAIFQENLAEYSALRSSGKSHKDALEGISYLHPIQFARLKEYLDKERETLDMDEV